MEATASVPQRIAEVRAKRAGATATTILAGAATVATVGLGQAFGLIRLIGEVEAAVGGLITLISFLRAHRFKTEEECLEKLERK